MTLPFDPSQEPICNIVWKHVDELDANVWNPNVVLNQELQLLERSILKTHWIQPLLVNKNGLIIDGFHRFQLSKHGERLLQRYGGYVPCAVLDLTDAEAMILTVRINRAKGTHVAFRMSAIVRSLIEKHHYDRQQVAAEIGATLDEVDLLFQKDVFEKKDIQNWEYSKAWVPHESSGDKAGEAAARAVSNDDIRRKSPVDLAGGGRHG
jgi:hypothetical protein